MPDPKIIVQGGYMTGDMFHVAPALLLNTELHLLILEAASGSHAEADDATVRMQGFYNACGIKNWTDDHSNGRIHIEAVPNPQNRYKAYTKWLADNIPPANIKVDGKIYSPFGVGEADNVIRDKYQSPQNAKGFRNFFLNKVFTGNTGARDAILGYFGTVEGLKNGQIDANSKFAVIYSRQSGKKGQAHPELDSSFAGITGYVQDPENPNDPTKLVQVKPFPQLIGTIKGKYPGRKVVFIGDLTGQKPTLPGGGDNPKYQPSIDRHKEALQKAGVDVNLGEYWTSPAFTAAIAGKNAPLFYIQTNLLFFTYLIETKKVPLQNIVVVGMRSGPLEGYALMGIPTVFLEEKNNEQRERLDKWIDKPPKFKRAALDKLPTRTGTVYQRLRFPEMLSTLRIRLVMKVNDINRWADMDTPPQSIVAPRMVEFFEGLKRLSSLISILANSPSVETGQSLSQDVCGRMRQEFDSVVRIKNYLLEKKPQEGSPWTKGILVSIVTKLTDEKFINNLTELVGLFQPELGMAPPSQRLSETKTRMQSWPAKGFSQAGLDIIMGQIKLVLPQP